MIKLIIFDLDGTLLNTLDDLADASNLILTRHGFPVHELDEYRYFVGNGIYKLMERAMPPDAAKDTALVSVLRDEMNTYYSEHNNEKTAPYPGVIELIKTVRERGIKTAVLSNKPHEFTLALCEELLGGGFELALGQREGYPVKPDRRLTQEIMETAGVTAEETLYLGDSGVDMQTAKNGGIFAIGALWGFRERDELLENGADALISTPCEILGYIK